MNRRKFIQMIGIVPASIAAAPLLKLIPENKATTVTLKAGQYYFGTDFGFDPSIGTVTIYDCANKKLIGTYQVKNVQYNVKEWRTI